jgi:hypothetical protein
MFVPATQVLDEAQKVAVNARVGFVRIDGSTSQPDRHTAVQRFQNDPNVRLAILSIKAAGQGLTLTAASTVVFAEMTWVPGELLQAEDRAHRIGQRSAVCIHYLIAPGSIDDVMWSTLERKVQTLSEVLDGKTESLGQDRVSIETATGASQGGDQAAAVASQGEDSAPPREVSDEYVSVLRGSSGQKKRARGESNGSSEDGQPAKKPTKGVFSIFAKRDKSSEAIRKLHPTEPWACGACSFLNAKQDRSCEMCTTKRSPPKAAGPSEPSTQVGSASKLIGGEDDGQQSLLFAVSEHAGRVHVFRHPTTAEAAEAVGLGAEQPQPVKLCSFHPLELPVVEHAGAAMALAKLPAEVRPAVDQAMQFCKEWRQLTSVQQAKLIGRPSCPPLRTAVFHPPRLVRSVVPEWGSATTLARERKSVDSGDGIAASDSAEARSNASGLKRQATDGSTTRETNPQAWLQRHTSVTTASDDTAAMAPGASLAAGKVSPTDPGSEGAIAAVVAASGVGELTVQVHSWTERAKKTKSKAGKDAPAQREWHQAFECDSGRPCCILCLAAYDEADRVKCALTVPQCHSSADAWSHVAVRSHVANDAAGAGTTLHFALKNAALNTQ